MNQLIQWCNSNVGFVTAILTLFMAFLSIIAIIVSIRTARLPYKSGIELGATTNIPVGYGTQDFMIYSYSATACNIGNRSINLKFLGFGMIIDGSMKTLYPLQNSSSVRRIIEPSMCMEVEYIAEDFVNFLAGKKTSQTLYICAIDSKGKTYKKKWLKVANIIQNK